MKYNNNCPVCERHIYMLMYHNRAPGRTPRYNRTPFFVCVDCEKLYYIDGSGKIKEMMFE